jgi:hypothetical protein
LSSGTEENLSRLQERVETGDRESNSRLGEFTSKLDRLQDQVTAACRHVGQPPVSSSTGSSIETGPSTSTGTYDIRHANDQQERECEARTSADVQTISSVNVDNSSTNNVIPSHAFDRQGMPQCHSSSLNELLLPIYSNSSKQKI